MDEEKDLHCDLDGAVTEGVDDTVSDPVIGHCHSQSESSNTEYLSPSSPQLVADMVR